MTQPRITPLHDRTNSRDPAVALVQHRDVSVLDLKAYRNEHGCSLKEAVDALGWKGNRIVRRSELGPNGELPL